MIYSENISKYIKYIKEVFRRLKEYSLRINLKKYSFGVKDVEFLGFIITLGHLTLDKKRVKVVVE